MHSTERIKPVSRCWAPSRFLQSLQPEETLLKHTSSTQVRSHTPAFSFWILERWSAQMHYRLAAEADFPSTVWPRRVA